MSDDNLRAKDAEELMVSTADHRKELARLVHDAQYCLSRLTIGMEELEKRFKKPDGKYLFWTNTQCVEACLGAVHRMEMNAINIARNFITVQTFLVAIWLAIEERIAEQPERTEHE